MMMRSRFARDPIPRDRPALRLDKAAVISAVLHLAVILGFALRASLKPLEPELDQEAIRVDLVGLPDKIKPAPLPPSASESKPETLPEPAKSEPARTEAPKPVVIKPD